MDKLSNKTKFLAVMMLSLLLAVLAFYRSVGPTIELMQQCRSMQKELDSTKVSGEELRLLQQELAQLNILVSSDNKNVDEINRGIVNFIGESTSDLNIHLVDFPSVHNFHDNDYEIFTHQAVVEGDFIPLLELIYRFEFHFEGARVCAVRFYTKEEFRTKQKHLYTMIYIQNIKKHA